MTKIDLFILDEKSYQQYIIKPVYTTLTFELYNRDTKFKDPKQGVKTSEQTKALNDNRIQQS